MRKWQSIKLLYKLSTLIAASILSFSAGAQSMADTLKPVKIHRKRKQPSSDIRITEFATGLRIQTIDSITLEQFKLQNVATLISQQLPVFVKSYSFNGLATLHFRGASAAQSQVLWNGVPIQNAALGMADISTVPVLFMSKVNVIYGSSGALLGSGNVGGTLMLENEQPVFDTNAKHLAICGGAGSFGQYSGGIKGSISGKRWFLSANSFIQTAQNNYAYTDATGNEQKMRNARLQSNAALLQTAYKLDTHNTIGFTLWHQQYERQIPPALFETYSVKRQQDKSLRLLADWKRYRANTTTYVKTSFISDAINYTDSAVDIATSNSVFQFYSESGWKIKTDKYGQILFFLPIQYAWIPLANSVDTQTQFKGAIVVAYSMSVFNERLHLSAQARGEQINTQSVFLPGGGITYNATDWLQLRANAQRTYRMPSLNELYYFPGGNVNLKPEQGWSEDAGYTMKTNASSFTFYHDVSVFNRDIRDWIQWLGGAIWTPHNIATVHSRGIETENKFTLKAGNWTLHLGANTSYIIATTTSSYILNDGSIGKQIPYAPRYNVRLNAGFTFKQLYMNYNHTYTGYRFITSDESAYLEPYQTGNIQAMYSAKLLGKNNQVNTQYNNIWGARYAVAGFRPMPLANWLLGFRMVF